VVCAVGKLYAVGGHDGNEHLKSGEVFDPLTNTWQAIAPMSKLRYYCYTVSVLSHVTTIKVTSLLLGAANCLICLFRERKRFKVQYMCIEKLAEILCSLGQKSQNGTYNCPFIHRQW